MKRKPAIFLITIFILLLGCSCSHFNDIFERDKSTRLGQYSFYLGNLHSHSVYSGDQAKVVAEKFNKGVRTYEMHTPAQVLEKARDCGYDFYAITDHSSPEQNDYYANGFTEEHWQDIKAQAEKYTSDTFLPLYGFEFSRNKDPDRGGFGHMNVFNTDSWKSAYAPGNTFEALYDWMTSQRNPLIIAQFNHPSAPFSKDPAKDFNDYAGRTKERNDIVVLAEIWNSGDVMWFADTVHKIWALGWKVAPTAGTDVHGLYGIEKRTLRTGVLAKTLTKEDILKAIKARRVYATVEPKLQLEFRLNGRLMGETLEHRFSGKNLDVNVFAKDLAGSTMDRIEVCVGKYDPNAGRTTETLRPVILAALPVDPESDTASGSISNADLDFFYVQVFKQGKKDPIAFSSPIWMDNR